MLSCLFQVCQGRIQTPTKTYTEINCLSVSKYPWCKIFLLMQTYLEELLNDDTAAFKIFSHNGAEPKLARTLDKKAIKELSKEATLLTDAEKIFADIVRYYTEACKAGGNTEKKLLASATLMKAIGKVLWSVAEQIYGIARGVNPEKKTRQLCDSRAQCG